MIYDASRLIYFEEWFSYEQWEEEETQQLLRWKEEVKEIAEKSLGLTEEEQSELEQEISEKGYLTFDLCKRLGKKIYKRQAEK